MPSENYKALAIDGGGTKCRLAMVSESSYEYVVSGSANACADFNGTVGSILSGVEQLAEHLAISPQTVISQPAYIGLAGVVDAEIAEQLRLALPFSQMIIEDDRRSALRGAQGTDNGFIAHCGTGSFFAVQENGVQKFAGGWGPVLDDVASAYWVGRQALSLTLYAFDGLEKHSDMTDALLSKYGDTASVVGFASNASSADIAHIAQSVTQYAEQKDPNALNIMQQGASLINHRLLQLGWTDGAAICLTGGIGGQYQRFLPQIMQSAIVTAKGEPLDGAVALARQFQQGLST